MTYQSKTFDFGRVIKAIREAVTEMTGLPVVPTNKQKLPDYPYITYDMTQHRVPESWSNTHELELFQTFITLNCYAKTPHEASDIADDVETLLFDPNYHHKLKQEAGIIVMDATDNGASASDFAQLFSIYQQSITVQLRLLRNYVSDFPRITNTDLGGQN